MVDGFAPSIPLLYALTRSLKSDVAIAQYDLIAPRYEVFSATCVDSFSQ